MVVALLNNPAGPSTQDVFIYVPDSIASMILGTRALKYWVHGLSKNTYFSTEEVGLGVLAAMMALSKTPKKPVFANSLLFGISDGRRWGALRSTNSSTIHEPANLRGTLEACTQQKRAHTHTHAEQDLVHRPGTHVSIAQERVTATSRAFHGIWNRSVHQALYGKTWSSWA